MSQTYILKVLRGHPGEGQQYFEEFELECKPFSNIVSALLEIQRYPINREGKQTEPVVFEIGCLEEVCGSCSMLINGVPRQACTALIDSLIKESGSSTITVAPLSKFPLIRDLMCDRSKMFENLKKVHAWIEVDDSRDTGPGPKITPQQQEVMYQLSTCMTCGCCQEACPQVNTHSKFMGPSAIGQVRLFDTHPIGKFQKPERLRVMMGDEGISGCGNAQNCVRVCPKNIPLTDAIAAVGRDVTLQAIKDLFSLPERE
ncbi:MAG: sdhB [Chlamydiia bacterium]|nr:sdhB [Chlamydiia bacterium]